MCLHTFNANWALTTDPTNQEPDPAQVVQQFQNQQTKFNQQLQNQPGAPSGIQTSLSGKQQPTAVQGQIPPQPVAPPTSTSEPVVTNPTSAANALQVLSSIITLVTVMFVF